jgi:hypothetical protein
MELVGLLPESGLQVGPFGFFLGRGRFAAKTPIDGRWISLDFLGFPWISLDFLGFYRPNRDFSMGYAA